MLTKELFHQMLAQLPYKKELPDALYLHKETLARSHKQLSKVIDAIANALKIPPEQWNIAKLSKTQFHLSLLWYPDFFDQAYPELKQSISVDLARLSHKTLRYNSEENPPILHRKELMLLPEHPRYQEYVDITLEAELAGLFEQAQLIGFRDSWFRLIEKKGYVLLDGRLFRAAMLPPDEQHKVDRHRTALVRNELSQPLKLLERHGFIHAELSFFDYGCGRGDDLTELQDRGIQAQGWDPNYRPDNSLSSADVVNLGYVINVIEDIDERLAALTGAWQLADKLLVVSAMLANDDFIARFKPYKDGVLTSRNTFQKYYQQAELKGFIERSLGEVPVAVAPGIFFVFKDKEAEQLFLASKQRGRALGLTERAPRITKKVQQAAVFAEHKAQFDALWQQCLELCRQPGTDEYPALADLLAITGSLRTLQKWLQQHYDVEALAVLAQQREQDLLVYFALNLFEKRRHYQKMPLRIQNDVRQFFGTFKSAEAQASSLLRMIAQPALIEEACNFAHQALPASQLNDGHSLILHKDYLNSLPALLRVYVGAALQLYGDLTDIDLIKIHITSGKVSLMGYDDFDKPVPLLRERIKIKMAEQKVDFFDYVDEWQRPPFNEKHLVMAGCNSSGR
jgi:DNA phosphorothioation-associated putative methyltransferase